MKSVKIIGKRNVDSFKSKKDRKRKSESVLCSRQGGLPLWLRAVAASVLALATG